MTQAKQLPKRMNAADAWFLYFERPQTPLHIGSLGIFEGKIPVEKTIEGLAQRLHLIPRYRQRAVFPPLFSGHPTWEDDPNFSLDRHVRQVDLPAPGTDQQLRQLTGELFEEMLPRDRPLWDIVVVHGLQGDRTAYVSRVHHCLVDGVSGIELLLALLDMTPNPIPIPPPSEDWQPEPVPDPLASWAEALLDRWSKGVLALVESSVNPLDPGGTVRRVTEFARAVQTTLPAALRLPSPAIWNRSLSSKRAFAFNTFSFQEVRGIRGALGGTVNDVCLTILGGAFGSYLQMHGENVKNRRLRLMTPVNVRSDSQAGEMGNRVSMMLPELPVGIEDPVERLAAIREEMDRRKASNQGGAFDELMRLGELAPSAFHAMAGMAGIPRGTANFVCTNVPGPLIPLYGSGHRMIASWPLLPLAGDLGLGVAITSYDKSLYFGISCDPTIVTDVDKLSGFIDEEFQRLREIAGVPASDLPDEIGVKHDAPPAPVMKSVPRKTNARRTRKQAPQASSPPPKASEKTNGRRAKTKVPGSPPAARARRSNGRPPRGQPIPEVGESTSASSR